MSNISGPKGRMEPNLYLRTKIYSVVPALDHEMLDELSPEKLKATRTELDSHANMVVLGCNCFF